MKYAISDTAKLLLSKVENPQVRGQIEMLLSKEAALYGPATPEVLERVQISVIKLAIQTPSQLSTAEKLYTQDTRDLLVAAGFANDLETHKTWAKSILEAPDA